MILSSPVSISRDIFIDTLHSDLDASASVAEHLVEVRLEAVVGSSLDGDADTLGSEGHISKQRRRDSEMMTVV